QRRRRGGRDGGDPSGRGGEAGEAHRVFLVLLEAGHGDGEGVDRLAGRRPRGLPARQEGPARGAGVVQGEQGGPEGRDGRRAGRRVVAGEGGAWGSTPWTGGRGAGCWRRDRGPPRPWV